MDAHRQLLVIACAFLLGILPAPASAQPPEGADVRRLGESISLGLGSTLTVTREDAQSWRSRYPDKLPGAQGMLVAFSFRFGGTPHGFIFGIDNQDPSKSDILLRCGSRAFNFDKMAAPNPQAKRVDFGNRSQAGGLHFQGQDGREYGLIFADDKINQPLVFFFDVPTSCESEKLLLSITQELDKVKRTFVFDTSIRVR